MVKVKIIDSEWEHLKQYVGNTYDAFKLEFDDGRVDYQVQIDKCATVIFSQAECEEIEDEPMTELASIAEEGPVVLRDNTEFIKYQKQILFVEDCSIHSDDFDYLVDWCDNHGIKIVIYKCGTNKPEFLGN